MAKDETLQKQARKHGKKPVLRKGSYFPEQRIGLSFVNRFTMSISGH